MSSRIALLTASLILVTASFVFSEEENSEYQFFADYAYQYFGIDSLKEKTISADQLEFRFICYYQPVVGGTWVVLRKSKMGWRGFYYHTASRDRFKAIKKDGYSKIVEDINYINIVPKNGWNNLENYLKENQIGSLPKYLDPEGWVVDGYDIFLEIKNAKKHNYCIYHPGSFDNPVEKDYAKKIETLKTFLMNEFNIDLLLRK